MQTIDEQIAASTAVILAGGQGRRMDHQNKSGLLWKGETFLTVLRRELAVFPACLVSVDRRGRFDPALPMVEDRYPGAGPLGAIASCLGQAGTPLVFFAACDMPLLTMELVRFVYSCRRPGDEICLPCTADGRVHPLCGVYAASLLPRLETALAGGERRVMAFARQQALRLAPVPPALEPQLTNVNTPEVYRQLTGPSGGHSPV